MIIGAYLVDHQSKRWQDYQHNPIFHRYKYTLEQNALTWASSRNYYRIKSIFNIK